MCHLILFRH